MSGQFNDHYFSAHSRRRETEKDEKFMTWNREQASAIADIQQRLADLNEKLDLVLQNCCSHRSRVASHESGSLIVCEDCKQVVGRVP